MQTHFYKWSQIYFYIILYYYIKNLIIFIILYLNVLHLLIITMILNSMISIKQRICTVYQQISLWSALYIFLYIFVIKLYVLNYKNAKQKHFHKWSQIYLINHLFIYFILHYFHLQKMICIVYLSVPLFIQVSEA